MEGWLIRGQGGVYTAEDESGEQYVLRAKNRFRRQRISPLVGDRIRFTPGTISDEHGWIDEILPRSSAFVRPAVANVTLMAIVVAPEPAPDLLLVDRLLVQCRRQDIRAVLVINKKDLDPALAPALERAYAGADVHVCAVSALSGEGADALEECLSGETICLSGQSGVGKSTLVNCLMNVSAETGEISRRILRGRNTTRHVELFRSPRFNLMDTPGFSLITLSEEQLEPVLLQDSYPEFDDLRHECRFMPCWHQGEPGCRVREAVNNGRIDPGRYNRYLTLLRELDEAWRNRYV
ncbi:MAG: ribosome small subunit-dependent GTPase A [Clostridia bacterium]|nr:ribosome small subunit-dependent GTPase A [Clostridia bacterium]